MIILDELPCVIWPSTGLFLICVYEHNYLWLRFFFVPFIPFAFFRFSLLFCYTLCQSYTVYGVEAWVSFQALIIERDG